jgi:hypothetical protein
MKILRTTLLFIFGAFLFIQPAKAIISSTNATSTVVSQQSFALKQEFKAQKKLAKFEKIMQKVGIDTKDPVKKWLWFAGIALVASIVLYAIGQYTLGYLASSAAGIFFIVWLLKYLDVI